MRKKLIGGLAVIAFALATPVWADHGRDGWRHDRHDRHDRHGHKHHGHDRVVVREYVRPVPVYQQADYPAYQAPAAGISIVLPNLFFPFR